MIILRNNMSPSLKYLVDHFYSLSLSETDSFGSEFPGVCFKDRGVHLIEVSVKRVLCVDEQLTCSSFKDGKSISSQKFTEK